jgi:hypothetical protein
MMGVKAEICEGRWVDRRWATGALWSRVVKWLLMAANSSKRDGGQRL